MLSIIIPSVRSHLLENLYNLAPLSCKEYQTNQYFNAMNIKIMYT